MIYTGSLFTSQDPNSNEASETVAGDKDRVDDDSSGSDSAEDHNVMRDPSIVLGPYPDALDEHKGNDKIPSKPFQEPVAEIPNSAGDDMKKPKRKRRRMERRTRGRTGKTKRLHPYRSRRSLE